MMKQSLWALAAAALFSVMAAFVKLCSDVHGPIEMVFYRSLFGVLVISLFVFRNRATLTLKTPHIAGHIKRSVLGTLSIMLWFFTLGKMHFGTNMTLIYTTPLFMAANFVILALMRHKPAPWALVLATIAGFTGVTIVLQPSFNEGELIPALICLGVSLLDLVIYWQMKELGDMKEPSWRIVFYFTLFGTIAGLIACYVVEGGLHMPNAQGLVGILGMGLCATLGQICTTPLLRLRQHAPLLVPGLLRDSVLGHHQLLLVRRERDRRDPHGRRRHPLLGHDGHGRHQAHRGRRKGR